jgi:hypothetical protein
MRLPSGVTLKRGEVRVARHARESPWLLASIAGFGGLLAYATARPWTPKLEFPPYRAAMALVGAGLALFLLRILLNSTRFTLEGGELRVREGPIPPRRKLAISTSAIRSVGYAPLRGAYVVLHDGETVRLAYEEALPELPRLLVEHLGLEARLEPVNPPEP